MKAHKRDSERWIQEQLCHWGGWTWIISHPQKPTNGCREQKRGMCQSQRLNSGVSHWDWELERKKKSWGKEWDFGHDAFEGLWASREWCLNIALFLLHMPQSFSSTTAPQRLARPSADCPNAYRVKLCAWERGKTVRIALENAPDCLCIYQLLIL